MKKSDSKNIAKKSLVAAICIAFGILISAQIRSLPARVTNPVAPYSSLKETRDDLLGEQSTLKNEIAALQSSIQQIQNQSQSSLSKDQLDALNLKKAQAGLTKIVGPGVVITLDDSHTAVSSSDSIIHAADLRDLSNLLWSSGAEAIAINDQRIVMSTSIDCIVNTILINNTKLSTPFSVVAIGNQSRMADAIASSEVLSSIRQRVLNNGIIFQVQKTNTLTAPVFNGTFDINTRPNV